MLNSVIMTGRMVADPELRTTQSRGQCDLIQNCGHAQLQGE